MAIGPGKYDDAATLLRMTLDADGVVLLVFGGQLGNGSSIQATFEVISKLPTILRGIADELEGDLKKVGS